MTRRLSEISGREGQGGEGVENALRTRVDVYREFVAFEIRQRAGRAPARVVPATDERALRLLRAATRARAGARAPTAKPTMGVQSVVIMAFPTICEKGAATNWVLRDGTLFQAAVTRFSQSEREHRFVSFMLSLPVVPRSEQRELLRVERTLTRAPRTTRPAHPPRPRARVHPRKHVPRSTRARDVV